MKGRYLFFIFILNIFYFSNSVENVNSFENDEKNLEEILKSVDQESLNQKQLQELILCLNSLIKDQNTSKENKKDNTIIDNKEKADGKRWFKKRYLWSLLGLLGLIGINIGFFYKLFDRIRQNESELEKLKENCKIVQQEQKETIKNIETECLDQVEKVVKSLDEKLFDLEGKTNVEYNKSSEKVLRDLRELEREVNVVCDRKVKENKIICKQEIKNLNDKIDRKNKEIFMENIKVQEEHEKNMEQEARQRHEQITKKFEGHIKIVEEEMDKRFKLYAENKWKNRSFWDDFWNLENFGIKSWSDTLDFLVNGTEGVHKTTSFVDNCANLVSAFSRLSDGQSSSGRTNYIPTEDDLER